jgi:4-hydroxy-2-oxoglutarate aldolase
MGLTLRGVYAPVATPFRQGAVDLDGFSANLTRYADTGLAGVVVLGSTGEAALLDDDEADRVLVAARRVVPSGKALIAGTGRESTAATIAACRRAADAGSDIVLVRTPSFFKGHMTGDAFRRHYESVADASPLPVLLYNVTVFTGVTLPADTAGQLARHHNIVGIKDSGSDLEVFGRYLAVAPVGFAVLTGSTAAFYPALCQGAHGAVLGVAGVVPDICAQIFEHATAGRHDEALALQRRMGPLADAVGARWGVPGLKAALDLAGYAGGDPRPPLLAVPADAVATIREHLHALLAAA